MVKVSRSRRAVNTAWISLRKLVDKLKALHILYANAYGL